MPRTRRPGTPYDGLSLIAKRAEQDATDDPEEGATEPDEGDDKRDLKAEAQAAREAREDGAGSPDDSDPSPTLTDTARAILEAQDAPLVTVHRGGGNYYTWRTDEGHEFLGHTRGKDRLHPGAVLLDGDDAAALLATLDTLGG